VRRPVAPEVKEKAATVATVAESGAED